MPPSYKAPAHTHTSYVDFLPRERSASDEAKNEDSKNLIVEHQSPVALPPSVACNVFEIFKGFPLLVDTNLL